MKKLHFLCLVISFLSLSQARASGNEADVACGNKDGIVALVLPTSSTPARMWQTEAGTTSKLEFRVTQFKVGQCNGCLAFNAVLDNRLEVRGTMKNFIMKYEGRNIGNPDAIIMGNWATVDPAMKCSKVHPAGI